MVLYSLEPATCGYARTEPDWTRGRFGSKDTCASPNAIKWSMRFLRNTKGLGFEVATAARHRSFFQDEMGRGLEGSFVLDVG